MFKAKKAYQLFKTFVSSLAMLTGGNADFTAIPAEEMEWSPKVEKRGLAIHIKNLFIDPETRTNYKLVRYAAGDIHEKHVHPCGHGMYVLQGNLVTHKGTFAPNTFVWFPPGEVMEHGASPEGDVVVLFVSNAGFSTTYPDHPEIK